MRYIKSFANDAAIQAAVDNKTLGKPYVALDDQLHRIDWNGKEETPDYSKMYLTIEALEDGNLRITKTQNTRVFNLYYSINGGNWDLTSSGYSSTIHLEEGDKIRFKGNMTRCEHIFCGSTLSINVFGNIESLYYGDDFEDKTTSFYCSELFKNSGLVDASNLILPATTLINGAYSQMFNSCTNLVSIPVLHASVLSKECYANMFRGDASLREIKCLATDMSATSCLLYWVFGVSPTGTFVKKAGVTWPTGDNGIPSGWTVIEE